MKAETLIFRLKDFFLECGECISEIEIQYVHLNRQHKDAKLVWVCHALTGNADVRTWWPGLFNAEALFGGDDYQVLCANVLGSCYGTTGPRQWAEREGCLPHEFPLVSTRDMARLHVALFEHLQLTQIDLLIGASLGGQQALEMAILLGNRVEKGVFIACNAQHSAWGKAFNETQRMALEADDTFFKDPVNGGVKGLAAARAIAMLSYRSYEGYVLTQSDETIAFNTQSRAASYQRYQGDKLTGRFCPYAYYALSRSMDSHHLGRGRASLEEALAQIRCRSLVTGISSDLLFPISEQQFLAKGISGATYREINSRFGHDGFLVETQVLTQILQDFI